MIKVFPAVYVWCVCTSVYIYEQILPHTLCSMSTVFASTRPPGASLYQTFAGKTHIKMQMKLYTSDTSLTLVWSEQLSAPSCNLSSSRLEHASLGCVLHRRRFHLTGISQVRLLYTCWQDSFLKSGEYEHQLLCNKQPPIALFSAQSQRCIWAS